MATIKISIPNDYGSEAHMAAAIQECYSGDSEAAEQDSCQQIFEVLADFAKGSGLRFHRDTDFGAEWRGTQNQIKECLQHLPAWAGASTPE